MAARFCGTTTQLMNWCHAHGYQLPLITKHGDNMSFLSQLPWWLLIAGCVVAYGVGRVGLSQAWSDLKSVGSGLSTSYAWIRNKFSGSKTTPTPTQTVSTSSMVS